MRNDKSDLAAQLLANAWRDKVQVKDFPDELRPVNRAEAYAIQNRMAALLGYEVIGWKLGVTSKNGLKANKMDAPVPGRMFAPFFANSPAKMKKSDFIDPVVEPEFAFRLTDEIRPRAEPYTREYLAAISVLHLAIEVAGVRVPQPTFDGLMMIADDGGNAAFVAGPQVVNWTRFDLPKVPVALEFDGKVAAQGFTGDDRCDPLWVLAWLANDLSARGITMPRGSWISTGTSTKAMPVGAASEVVAAFEGVGKATLTFI